MIIVTVSLSHEKKSWLIESTIIFVVTLYFQRAFESLYSFPFQSDTTVCMNVQVHIYMEKWMFTRKNQNHKGLTRD